MAIRDISDLRLDEITEEFLTDQLIDMGMDLNVDTNQGSIYRDAGDGHIIRTAKFFNDLRSVNEIISLDTCTGEVLDEKMKEYGLRRNPPESTPAVYYAKFVGAEPEEGDVMSCADHFFRAVKLESRWAIRSEETGTEMNSLVPGLAIIPEIDIDLLESATLEELAVPALDIEDDDSARRRLHNSLSGPDECANISQVRTWCEGIEGVGRARIIPCWNGPMTVKAILISKDGGVPTEEVVSSVQKIIDPGSEGMGEGKAPIGQKFTAEAVEGVKVNLSVEVVKKVEGSYSKIKTDIEEALKAYCKSIALEDYSADIKLRYTRISAMISDIPDVVDHETLLINGGTGNISFTVSQIPVFGEVTVSGDI